MRRVAALLLLAALAAAQAEEIARLRSQHPAERRKAALTLAGLGRAALDAVPALEKAARDDDQGVAGAARKALKRING